MVDQESYSHGWIRESGKGWGGKGRDPRYRQYPANCRSQGVKSAETGIQQTHANTSGRVSLVHRPANFVGH